MANPMSKEEWEEFREDIPDRTIYIIYRYFTIVQDNYKICMRYKTKLEAVKDGSTSEALTIDKSLQNEYSEKIVIVFSGIFLEAVINDYGASNLSGTYMENYLDKLDIKSKWVIIPKLVTGKDFPTDSQAFELLGKLKTSRDKLVHYKTKEIPKTYEEYIEWEHLKLIDVDDAYKCIRECLVELNKIDNTNWHFFTSKNFVEIAKGKKEQKDEQKQ